MSAPSFGFAAFVRASHTTARAAVYAHGQMLFQLRDGRTIVYRFWQSRRSDHEPANDR
jgi:hypothetical protein